MSSTRNAPPAASESVSVRRAPYASWVAAVCLLHGLVYLWACLVLGRFESVAVKLGSFGLYCLLLAPLAMRWPRLTGWLAALLFVGIPGFYLSGMGFDVGVATGVLPALGATGAVVFGAAVIGLLLTRSAALARLLLLPTLLTLLAGVAVAVSGSGWLERRERAYLQRVDELAAHLTEASATLHDLPTALAREPPAGSRAFAAELRAAQSKPRELAQRVAKELRTRAMVCMPLHKVLRAAAGGGYRSKQELVDAVSAGLRACPFSGVDLDGLEYTLLFIAD